MSLKPTSKELLASALKTLLRETDLDNIKVERILEISGVSRATFYKYFYGKHELAEYVFLNELANVSFFDYARPLEEREIEVLHYLGANRTFYRNALTSREFRDAWMRAACQADTEYLKIKYANRDVPADDITLFAEFVSRTMVDATWLWLTSANPRPPEELAKKLTTFVEHGTSALIEPRNREL